MELLDCPIQPYAWGSRTTLARMQGRHVPSDGPEAELWVGAHPKAPAVLSGAGALTDVIAADPEHQLGSTLVRRFGPTLPFLLKVLAVEAPLSLQAHPSRAQAEAGYDAERSAAGEDPADHRYADRWPKPELLVALSPFTALCGFRPPEGAAAWVERLGVPALRPLAERVAAGRAALPGLLADLLTGTARPIDGAVPDVVAQLAVAAAGLAEDGDGDAACLLEVAAAYPADAGVLAALLLNVVRLAPGEAVHLPPGNLHAYVRGTGIEVMANSDNVLRGGLTPKAVHVPELLRVLDFDAEPPRVLRPERVGAEWVYPVPVEEFRLSRLDVEGAPVTLDRRGPQLLLCVAGEVTCSPAAQPAEGDDAGGTLRLTAGQAAYAAADDPEVTLRGSGTVFRATAGC